MPLENKTASFIAELGVGLKLSVVCSVIANPLAIDSIIFAISNTYKALENEEFFKERPSPIADTLSTLKEIKKYLSAGKTVVDFISDYPKYWMSDLLE